MKAVLYIHHREQVIIPQHLLLEVFNGNVRYKKYANKMGYIYAFDKTRSFVPFIQPVKFDALGFINQEHQMQQILEAINAK